MFLIFLLYIKLILSRTDSCFYLVIFNDCRITITVKINIFRELFFKCYL